MSNTIIKIICIILVLILLAICVVYIGTVDHEAYHQAFYEQDIVYEKEMPRDPEPVVEIRSRCLRVKNRDMAAQSEYDIAVKINVCDDNVSTHEIDENAIEGEKTASETISEHDLQVLSWIMYAEAGSSWIPDEVQQYVGSVVLNRVNSSLFPDTIYDVVYQKGQYQPTWSGLTFTPDERTIENARYLLENGSILPENVLFQANFKQGSGIYYEYVDPYLGSTYFCYA